MELKIDKNKIIDFSKKHHLKLLILHGSYAQGNATPQSDIDIGILSQDKIDWEKYSAILRNFGEIFGDKFDPVFLNNAEPMINYYVALKGKVLFEAAQADFANFKIQSIARYLDTKKFRDLEKQYIKRAVGKE